MFDEDLMPADESGQMSDDSASMAATEWPEATTEAAGSADGPTFSVDDEADTGSADAMEEHQAERSSAVDEEPASAIGDEPEVTGPD